MCRYEKRSTVMTSNLPREDWGKLLGDVPSAMAILEHFLHYAEIITLTGKSYRIREQAGKKGKTSTDQPEQAEACQASTK